MPNQPLTDADWATIDGVRNASSYLSLLSELQKDYQPIQGFQAHSGGGGMAGSPGPIQQLATDYEQAKANKDDQADTQDKPEPPEPVNPMSIEAYKTNPQGYASRLQEWSGLHAPGAGVTSDYDQVAPPDPEDPNYVEAPGQYAADVAQWLSSRGVKAQSKALLAQTPVEQPVPIQPGGSFADILSSASPPSVTSGDLSGTGSSVTQLPSGVPVPNSQYPEDPGGNWQANYVQNLPYVKHGYQDYNTQLTPQQEQQFEQWVGQNKVPFDPSTGVSDYDMRGFWLAMNDPNNPNHATAASAIDPNDKQIHYPDFWKTPLHQTFSNESQWATSNAPQWNDKDQLVDQNGNVVYDDRVANGQGPTGYGRALMAAQSALNPPTQNGPMSFSSMLENAGIGSGQVSGPTQTPATSNQPTGSPKATTYALGDAAPKATGVLTEDVPNLVSWAAPQLGSNATPAMTEILRLLGTPYSASKAGIADSDYEKGELPPIGVDGTRDDDDLGAWVEQNYPQVFAAWQKMNP